MRIYTSPIEKPCPWSPRIKHIQRPDTRGQGQSKDQSKGTQVSPEPRTGIKEVKTAKLCLLFCIIYSEHGNYSNATYIFVRTTNVTIPIIRKHSLLSVSTGGMKISWENVCHFLCYHDMTTLFFFLFFYLVNRCVLLCC